MLVWKDIGHGKKKRLIAQFQESFKEGFTYLIENVLVAIKQIQIELHGSYKVQ